MYPIPTHPVPSQLERLRPFIEGRDCLVVGSAPLPTEHAQDRPGEVVIAVNGGISSCAGIPSVWFVNSKQQDRPGDKNLTPLHKRMMEQATNRRVHHIVLLRGSKVASEEGTFERLDQLCVRRESWSLLDKTTKAHVESILCDRNLGEKRPCSSGLLAVAVAFWCGASNVRMEGFSWSPGHHYKLPQPIQKRWHDVADKRALKELYQRFGDRLQTTLLKRKVAA